MRIAVVTAIIGSNEKLSDPPIFHSDCDYVAFVDRMHENIRVWKQILVGSYSENAFFRDRIDSKIYKILPEVFLPEYDFYAWVDAAHAYQNSPKKLIAQAGRFDYLVFRHGKRNSVTSQSLPLYCCCFECKLTLTKINHHHTDISNIISQKTAQGLYNA